MPKLPIRYYRVLVGLNWSPNRRAEPGDIVTDRDLPITSIPHELEAKHIELLADDDPAVLAYLAESEQPA